VGAGAGVAALVVTSAGATCPRRCASGPATRHLQWSASHGSWPMAALACSPPNSTLGAQSCEGGAPAEDDARSELTQKRFPTSGIAKGGPRPGRLLSAPAVRARAAPALPAFVSGTEIRPARGGSILLLTSEVTLSTCRQEKWAASWRQLASDPRGGIQFALHIPGPNAAASQSAVRACSPFAAPFDLQELALVRTRDRPHWLPGSFSRHRPTPQASSLRLSAAGRNRPNPPTLRCASQPPVGTGRACAPFAAPLGRRTAALVHAHAAVRVPRPSSPLAAPPPEAGGVAIGPKN
jgi:hypothetical protein